MGRITILSGLLCACTVLAQDTSLLPPPRRLVESSSQSVDVPKFASIGAAQCDTDGDVFFHVPLHAGVVGENTVLRLSRDSSTPALYHLSQELANEMAFASFSVTPMGTVRFLDVAHSGGIDVFSFDSDAEMDSQIKLATPEHLEPTSFMTSEDGLIFLAGFFNSDAPETQRGKHFEAIFDKSGILRREISSEDEKDVDLKQVPRFGDVNATWGVDGNFYFLREHEVVVISMDGTVVRRMPFESSEPKSHAANLGLSGGLVSVQFQKADENHRLHAEYLVMDATTGTTVGRYLPPEETGSGFAVCFSAKSGYTFLHHDKTGLKLLTAGLR